jgi:ribose transport system permease protein
MHDASPIDWIAIFMAKKRQTEGREEFMARADTTLRQGWLTRHVRGLIATTVSTPAIPFLLIVLRQAAPLALTAIGQSLPIVGRSIDLSIGGVIALSNVVLALPAVSKGPAWWSIALPLAIGAVTGLVNAVVVASIRASAVVATLGVSIMLVGASYIVSGGAPGGQVNPVIRYIATGRVGMIPNAAILLFAIAIVIAVFMRRSVFGHTLHAVGSSHAAAWLGGLAVSPALYVAHILSGILAGTAAIVLTGYIGTGTLNLGSELVLASVAAVVLGGTSFGGGQGGIVGVVVGALVLTFLANLLTGMGMPQPVQLIIQGFIIASAAALAARRKR